MSKFENWLETRDYNFSLCEIIEEKDIVGFINNMKGLIFPGFVDPVCDLKAYIAEKIVKAKGYDICQVDTVAPYTGTYGEIVD